MNEPRAGLFASLRALLATVLEIAQTRLELLVCELEQEKANAFAALWWGALSLLMLLAALVLAIGFVMFLLQEPYRLPALGVMALACAAAGVAMLRHARRRLHSLGGAFAATAGELAHDRAGLLGVE
ncbi:MAG: phage holin family protein [Burkholderiaceae bacterium]